MLSTSFINELTRYAASRLITMRIAALLILVIAVSLAISTHRSPTDVGTTILLASLLIVQFRLWDDLADLDFDRNHHPDRTLVTSDNIRPFFTLVVSLAVLNTTILAVLRSPGQWFVYILLLVGTAIIYHRRVWPKAWRVVHNQLVLMKYPVILYLCVQDGVTKNLVIGGIAVYILLSLIDLLSNASLHKISKKITPIMKDLEPVACYLCGGVRRRPLVTAEDDLTGKPGCFQFVNCENCGLAYQHPRLTLERIKDYYDDEYIAHRKKTDWGILTPLYRRAMDRHDRAKIEIVRRYSRLEHASKVLDVGCGAATFLIKLVQEHHVHATGIDFKDLSSLPGFDQIEFRCGLFYEQNLSRNYFDLITMWHFLEHDYDPNRTLAYARDLLAPNGHLIIEVPRLDSLSFNLYRERWPGLQAPQHTVLYSKASLLAMVEKAGLHVVDYLPYGAFPAYFYLFTGLAFKFLKGKGLNLDRAVVPYFIGQALLSPVLLFARHLNLAMQTVILRRNDYG